MRGIWTESCGSEEASCFTTLGTGRSVFQALGIVSTKALRQALGLAYWERRKKVEWMERSIGNMRLE